MAVATATAVAVAVGWLVGVVVMVMVVVVVAVGVVAEGQADVGPTSGRGSESHNGGTLWYFVKAMVCAHARAPNPVERRQHEHYTLIGAERLVLAYRYSPLERRHVLRPPALAGTPTLLVHIGLVLLVQRVGRRWRRSP